MNTAPAGTPLAVATRNFPYLFDFFLGVDGPRARPGMLVDALPHFGGFSVFAGRYHLEVDVHWLRTVLRWLRP